jgi:uncharacterized protein YdaU (DUF1376 family)
MAKDPAFLFYPGDYISGTMYLDFECKGAYMDLLMLQFQKDHMTIHMIKHVLGHKFDHIWPLISDKFKENNGKYWNERLKTEKEKRVKFCKSRKDNRVSTKHMKEHMLQHMENVNININEDVIRVIKQLESLCKVNIEESQKNYFMYLVSEMAKMYLEAIPDYFFDKESDYSACLQIAYKIALMKKWARAEVVNGKMNDVLESWKVIIPFIKSDSWLKNRSLSDISQTKEWQRLVLKMKNYKNEPKQRASEIGQTIEFDRP